jgi:NOL1/NOP2/sun family putative RNA methylase
MTVEPTPAGVSPAFLARMEQLLDKEYGAFLSALSQPRRVGLRVNTLKISAADFNRISPFPLLPVGEFEEAAFLLAEEVSAGSHPHHAAGLYYLQEPSAMVAGSLLDPRPGELVLDLAAAPGGKATHLAARMQNRGLLVANDMQRGRARVLAQNLERLGVTNAVICDETPERLANTFGPIFDRVLLDAPCSGEGLFRRMERVDWSPAIVTACARRQTGILTVAAQLVRPGGILAYATCTFSPEEDEEQIDRFLAAHPEFTLTAMRQYTGFTSGRPDWVSNPQLSEERRAELARAVRLWPHMFPGEGHFLALMTRTALAGYKKPLELLQPKGLKSANSLWREFQRQALLTAWPEERLHQAGDRLYVLPEPAVDTGSLHLLRYGLFLGEARRSYFRPAHTLAMALTPEDVQQSISWPVNAPQITAYLEGHDMPSDGPDGWVLVTVEGYPLGWGKRSSGRLKNHYPRGLRRPA